MHLASHDPIGGVFIEKEASVAGSVDYERGCVDGDASDDPLP